MASSSSTLYDGLGMEDFECCPMCECWLARERQWQHHLDTVHTLDEAEAINLHMSFMCPICYERIPDGPSLQDHMECCHPKPDVKKAVRCHICLEWFPDWKSWDRHLCHQTDVEGASYRHDFEVALYLTHPPHPSLKGKVTVMSVTK